MKRIEWIDTAKGFGILLVILGHVILLNPSSNSNDLRLSAIIYSFHMPLFFMLNINLHLMTISNPLLFLLTGVLGSSSLIILSMIFSKDKILGILGRRSLDLMALHYPPIPIIKVASIICTLLIGKESVTVTFVFALLGLWALDICYEFVLKTIRQKG